MVDGWPDVSKEWIRLSRSIEKVNSVEVTYKRYSRPKKCINTLHLKGYKLGFQFPKQNTWHSVSHYTLCTAETLTVNGPLPKKSAYHLLSIGKFPSWPICFANKHIYIYRIIITTTIIMIIIIYSIYIYVYWYNIASYCIIVLNYQKTTFHILFTYPKEALLINVATPKIDIRFNEWRNHRRMRCTSLVATAEAAPDSGAGAVSVHWTVIQSMTISIPYCYWIFF